MTTQGWRWQTNSGRRAPRAQSNDLEAPGLWAGRHDDSDDSTEQTDERRIVAQRTEVQ